MGGDGGHRCRDALGELADDQLIDLEVAEEDGSDLWRSDYANLLRGWPHL